MKFKLLFYLQVLILFTAISQPILSSKQFSLGGTGDERFHKDRVLIDKKGKEEQYGITTIDANTMMWYTAPSAKSVARKFDPTDAGKVTGQVHSSYVIIVFKKMN